MSKNNYINAELDWAEDHLAKWKDYVDKNPFNELRDRPMGRSYVSIEVQQKSLQDIMKNYLALLEVVNKLRENEEKKAAVRGKEDLSPLEAGVIRK